MIPLLEKKIRKYPNLNVNTSLQDYYQNLYRITFEPLKINNKLYMIIITAIVVSCRVVGCATRFRSCYVPYIYKKWTDYKLLKKSKIYFDVLLQEQFGIT